MPAWFDSLLLGQRFLLRPENFRKRYFYQIRSDIVMIVVRAASVVDASITPEDALLRQAEDKWLSAPCKLRQLCLLG